MKAIALLISHGLIGFAGFALGIYLLPILTEQQSPNALTIKANLGDSYQQAEFVRELQDSDFLHWGEGQLRWNDNVITFNGKLAPGPDYKLYLSPKFVETEKDFNALKSEMVQIGDIKSFDAFMLNIPGNVNINDYGAAIVWCETFGQFITAAKLQP